jgi:hypothetical protein
VRLDYQSVDDLKAALDALPSPDAWRRCTVDERLSVYILSA